MKRAVFFFASASLAINWPMQAEAASGAITAYYVASENTADPRSCVFFQVNNAPEWYGVSINDDNYAAEREFLLTQRLTKDSFGFSVGGDACGLPHAYAFIWGTPH